MPVLRADQVATVLRRGASTRVPAHAPARFATGAPVRARNLNPEGHTRIPRYVRGRRGVIVDNRGTFVFPDTHAASGGREPQYLYSVRFEADELWGAGDSARQRGAVYVDLFEPYLQAAPGEAAADTGVAHDTESSP